MSNWYSYIKVVPKSNLLVDEIVDKLSTGYKINMKNVSINKEKGYVVINGCEGDSIVSISDEHKFPDIADIFKYFSNLCVDSHYVAHAFWNCSSSGVEKEYEIIYKDKKLVIKESKWVSEIPIGSYDDYEEYCDCEGDYLEEDEFEEYHAEDVIYMDEDLNIYTEEEYYNSFEEYFLYEFK